MEMRSFDQYFSKFEGKQVTSFSRALDMVIIGMGKVIYKKTVTGTIKPFPEYAIHIQSRFRVVCNGKELLRSQDLLFANNYSKINVENTGFNPEDVFERIRARLIGRTVTKVECIDSVKLVVTIRDLIIEIDPTGCIEGEAWRVFMRGGMHLVCENGNLEFQ